MAEAKCSKKMVTESWPCLIKLLLIQPEQVTLQKVHLLIVVEQKPFSINIILKDDGMIARQLRDRDYYDADYIIAMDQMNVQDAKDMAPAGLENKVHGNL